MNFIFLALLSAISGATANTLARKITKYCGNSPEEYIPVHYTVLSALLLPFLPLFLHVDLNLKTGVLLLMLYVMDLFANYFYLKSFEIQRTYKISIIIATAPLWGLLAYPFFQNILNLKLSGYDFVGIIITIIGLFILSYRTSDDTLNLSHEESGIFYLIAHNLRRVPKRIRKKKIFYPLMSAILMGVSIYILKYLFVEDAINPYTYYTSRNIVFMIIFLLWLKPNFKDFLSIEGNIKWVTFRSIFVIAQWLGLLYAISLGDPLIAKALSDTIPLFVIVISYIIWHVRLRPHKIIGILVSTIGIMIVTIL